MLRSYGEAVRSPSPGPRGATGSALALAREGTVRSGWALRESGPGKAPGQGCGLTSTITLRLMWSLPMGTCLSV